MARELPEVRITWSWVHLERCALCGADWEMADIPPPGVHTARSSDAGDPPEPVCDICVEQHYPDLFEPLLADRRRYRPGLGGPEPPGTPG